MTRYIEDATTAARTCSRCRSPVVDTDVGFTHIDQTGALAGWLCPTPHDGLAQPLPLRQITTIPRRLPQGTTQPMPPRLEPRSP